MIEMMENIWIRNSIDSVDIDRSEKHWSGLILKPWNNFLDIWGLEIARCIMFVMQSPPTEPHTPLRKYGAYKKA